MAPSDPASSTTDDAKRQSLAAIAARKQVSQFLAKRIRSIVARRRGVGEKKIFGGVGFLLNGNMLVGVWKTGIQRYTLRESALGRLTVVAGDLQPNCGHHFSARFQTWRMIPELALEANSFGRSFPGSEKQTR